MIRLYFQKGYLSTKTFRQKMTKLFWDKSDVKSSALLQMTYMLEQRKKAFFPHFLFTPIIPPKIPNITAVIIIITDCIFKENFQFKILDIK